MRLAFLPTVLMAPCAALSLTAAALGQDNTFNATNSGDFNTQGNWTQGGPAGWAGGTAIDGALDFDADAAAGDVVVSGIDSDFTGITGLTTSGPDGTRVTLSGTGSLSFYNGGNTITIAPTTALTLAVRTIFAGDVHLNAEGLNDASAETMSIEADMTLQGANRRLTVTGSALVNITADANLTMNGTIQVGSGDAGSIINGNFQIERADSINGTVSLDIRGDDNVDSRVTLGDGSGVEQTFVFSGLTGGGDLVTNDASIMLNTGTSLFYGSLNIDGDFTITGSDTEFYYDPGFSDFGFVSGIINVLNGAGFYIGRASFGLPTITGQFYVDGGSFVGGDGVMSVAATTGNPNDALVIYDGWLVGGDQFGQGSLDLTGGVLSTHFGISPWTSDNSGLWINIDTATPNAAGRYITFNNIGAINFYAGANIHTNMFGDAFLSTIDEIVLLASLSEFSFINDVTFGMWDLTTNRVTRTIENIRVENVLLLGSAEEQSTSEGEHFIPGDVEGEGGISGGGVAGAAVQELLFSMAADYEAPAGDLRNLGFRLNHLIDAANTDPNSAAGQLLGMLDSYATSVTAYQQALSWMLPSAEFVADRVAAETSFYATQRDVLRELAIGSRAPGMVKAERGFLFASMQEADAVGGSNVDIEDATNQQLQDVDDAPRVVVTAGNGGKAKAEDSDVFQMLYVEGYARWDSMKSVAFVPGYNNTMYGIEGAWGIALDHGITLGISAGWEQNTATLDDDLGNVELRSFRGAPFMTWSGLSGKIEQYVTISAGGAYTDGSGDRENAFGTDAAIDLHGWQWDVTGSVGTRIPVQDTMAVQPEASIRYSMVHFDGTETDAGIESDYSGDDFQYFRGRLGVSLEWFPTPELRARGSIGYQGQYLNWSNASFSLPSGLGMVSESGGSGNVNQAYVGMQLEWAPSWNTAISFGYEGAFGQATQNSITGGFLLRF